MKPVAVTQRVDLWPDRHESRDALDRNMTRWLSAAGYLAFPMPNALTTPDEMRRWLDTLQPNGIVLSGGGDIDDDACRSATEYEVLNFAERNATPLLGICRGMQLLAHSRTTGLKAVAGHVRTRHRLVGEIDGEANSYHQLSIASCPEGFRTLAHSEDGEIEAIRHHVLPWEGWMWHPERESEFQQRDIARLKGLFK